MTLPDNILTPVGNLRGQLTSGGLIPGVPIVIGSTSGNIATFKDGTNNILKELIIEIDDVQGITNANITKAGKNIFNRNTIKSNTALDPTTGEEIDQNTTKVSDWIKVNPNTSYFWNGTSARVYYYQSDKTYISRTNIITNTYFNTGVNVAYIRIQSANASWNQIELQLESGTSHTEYNPYDATIYNIDWQSEAGTITNGRISIIDSEIYVNDGINDYYIGVVNIQTDQGVNNIWSDTGDINSCKYIANIQTFLQWVYDNLYNP